MLPLERWPLRTVGDSLELLQSFIGGDGNPPSGLFVHPRCKHMISAFANFKRATRGGQLMDYPDPYQHPAEDMIDALRGGLCAVFPEGRKLPPNLRTIRAGRIV